MLLYNAQRQQIQPLAAYFKQNAKILKIFEMYIWFHY